MASIGDVRFDLAYKYASDQDFFFSSSLGNVSYIERTLASGPWCDLTKGVKRVLEANTEAFHIYAKSMGSLTACY